MYSAQEADAGPRVLEERFVPQAAVQKGGLTPTVSVMDSVLDFGKHFAVEPRARH